MKPMVIPPAPVRGKSWSDSCPVLGRQDPVRRQRSQGGQLRIDLYGAHDLQTCRRLRRARLVANAVRHTPAGGTVSIGLLRRDHAVQVTVTDTGPGIAAEELDTSFDRYARSADSGGIGLGLAIARSLVEAHGGSIEAQSPPDGGATIRVRLPD